MREPKTNANILVHVADTCVAVSTNGSHLLCAACDGRMLSSWGTAALGDGEMDSGGEHEGECLVGEIGARDERQEGKGSKGSESEVERTCLLASCLDTLFS